MPELAGAAAGANVALEVSTDRVRQVGLVGPGSSGVP